MPYGNQRSIPPECFAAFYPPTQGQQGQVAGPQGMVLLTNVYTGKGQAEYSFDAPRSGKMTCTSATSISSVSCSIGETKETVETAQGTKTASKTVSKPVVVLTAKESKARKEKESQGKVSFIWSLQPQNKIEQEFTVKPDSEFSPQKIQLLRFLENPDSAEFKVEGIKKENCEFKGEVAKITCDGENKITFNHKLDYPKEGDNALGVGAPQSIEGEGEKCGSVTAAMENNEIKITADCTNFVKGGKLQPLAVYYTVKLTLPESAGGREIAIPFVVSDRPIQFDFTKPVILAPREASKGEQLTVKILYLVQDVESSRGAIAVGVSKDGKVRRQLTVANGSESKTLSFKMVNTDGSIAEIRASTKTAAGKTLESKAEIGLSGEAPAAGQGKDEEKQTVAPAGISTGGTTGGGVSAGGAAGGTSGGAIKYGVCTLKAGKRTKEITKDGSKILDKGVSSDLKGECGSVTQCTSSGGKAYTGTTCSGTGDIQCCVD